MNRPIEELLVEIADATENPLEVRIPKALEQEVAETLRTVEGLSEFLKATLAADMRRYFNASPEQQPYIKGAYQRTLYLLSLALPKEQYDLIKEKGISQSMTSNPLQTK